MLRRILEAFRVLLGQRLTPIQIQSEWVEYQQIFRDQLEQFSASLARQAKAEKKRLDRLGAAAEEPPPLRGVTAADDRAARKAELRRRVTAMNQPSGVINRVFTPTEVEP